MRFDELLDTRPFPARLGDVRLRYDGELLLGEADRPLPGMLGPALFITAVATALTALALVLFARSAPLGLGALLGVASGGLLIAAVTFDRRARRRRRFALHFFFGKLRLEPSPPIRGLPPSLSLPFEQVRALEVIEQGRARWALVAEVELSDGARVRDALIANVPPGELETLRRCETLLRAAVGLEVPPLTPSAG